MFLFETSFVCFVIFEIELKPASSLTLLSAREFSSTRKFMMLGLLTFTIFNFLMTISLEVLFFEKKFSVFSKLIQATNRTFSVSPSSLRRKSGLQLLVFSVTLYENKNRNRSID